MPPLPVIAYKAHTFADYLDYLATGKLASLTKGG